MGSARLALVTALALLAGCFALALDPPAVAAQSAFEEQYELDLGRSAPGSDGSSAAPDRSPAGATATAQPGATATEGSPRSASAAGGIGSSSRTSPPAGLSAAASGELPVAGYPLTPFLLLLLALLLGGLTVRSGLAVRARLRRRGPGPPSGAG